MERFDDLDSEPVTLILNLADDHLVKAAQTPLLKDGEHPVVSYLKLIAERLGKLQLRLFLFVKRFVVLVEGAALLICLLRLLGSCVVAQGQSKQELFEILVLKVRLLQQLISIRGLEPIEYLRLVGQVFKRLAVVFVARLRRVLALHVVNPVAIHLMPVVVLLVVAKEVTDFEGGHVAQISIEEGSLGADDSINLTKRLHRAQVSEVYVSWH